MVSSSTRSMAASSSRAATAAAAEQAQKLVAVAGASGCSCWWRLGRRCAVSKRASISFPAVFICCWGSEVSPMMQRHTLPDPVICICCASIPLLLCKGGSNPPHQSGAVLSAALDRCGRAYNWPNVPHTFAVLLQALPSLALWLRSALTCGPVLPALPTALCKGEQQ